MAALAAVRVSRVVAISAVRFMPFLHIEASISDLKSYEAPRRERKIHSYLHRSADGFSRHFRWQWAHDAVSVSATSTILSGFLDCATL